MDGQPIHYGLIMDAPPPPFAGGKFAEATLQKLAEKQQYSRSTRLGYAGCLTVSSEYQQELQVLVKEARELNRIHWMFQSVSELPAVPARPINKPEGEVLTKPEVIFVGSLKSFLTKWELIRLVTLDLPEPQGTMNAIPVHLLARLRGGAALVSYTPAFHETPSSADLRGDLIELQQLNGELNQNPMELPAAQTSPRASRESEFATLFRMWLMEITVRRRYALKHGMTGALVEGMSDALGKAASQLRMLRRKYAPNLQHHL